MEKLSILRNKFPNLTEAIVKEGIFLEPHIRKLMKDKIFTTKMQPNERDA